jgi:hypothetical protein
MALRSAFYSPLQHFGSWPMTRRDSNPAGAQVRHANAGETGRLPA